MAPKCKDQLCSQFVIPTRDLCVCVSASGAVHGHLGHLQCYSTSSRPHFRARETGSANVPLQDTSRKFQLANRCLSARAAQTTAAPHNRNRNHFNTHERCLMLGQQEGVTTRRSARGYTVATGACGVATEAGAWYCGTPLLVVFPCGSQRVSVDVTTNRNQRKIFRHFYYFLILVASPLQGSHNQDCDNLVEYSR